MNTLLQRTSLSAEEQRELAELEQTPLSGDALRELPKRARSHTTQHAPAMLLETASSSDNAVDTTYETFQKPQIWGPAAWFFLHSIALAQGDTVPDDKKERLRRFFTEDLAYLLPCPACARTVQDHVSAMEIDDDTFADRDSVFEFVWTLHNMVNADKGVPEIPFDESVLNYAQAFDQGITDLHFQSVNHVHDGEVEDDDAADAPAAEDSQGLSVSAADVSAADVAVEEAIGHPLSEGITVDDFLAPVAEISAQESKDRNLELLTKSGPAAMQGVTLADIFPFRLLR